MKILTQLAKVMAEVGVIGKKTKAPGLNYAFRGIDAVVAEVQPLFAAHGIVMCSRVSKAERDTYETAKGSRMISVRLTVEHDFWCAEDGSKVTCVTIGEAMDTSDKASNKAMTAAEKYALTQTLKIPTYEPERDVEQANHQISDALEILRKAPRGFTAPELAAEARETLRAAGVPEPQAMDGPPTSQKLGRPPATVHQFPAKEPTQWEVRINEAQSCAALAAIGSELHRQSEAVRNAHRALYTRRHTELAAKEKAK